MTCAVGCLYVPHWRVNFTLKELVSAGQTWYALMLAHLLAAPTACEDP